MTVSLRKQIEDKIRQDYANILAPKTIDATVTWWNDLNEPLYRKIEDLKEEEKLCNKNHREYIWPERDELKKEISALQAKNQELIKEINILKRKHEI